MQISKNDFKIDADYKARENKSLPLTCKGYREDIVASKCHTQILMEKRSSHKSQTGPEISSAIVTPIRKPESLWLQV